MFYKVGLAATAALIVATAPASAVTLVTTSGTASAGADATNTDDTQGSIVTDSWAGTPNALLADYTALAIGPNGGTASVTSHSAANWAASGLSGTVSLSNGWDFETLLGEGQAYGSFAQPSWTYVFTPDADANFNLDYDVSATGIGFALQGYYITVDGAETGLWTPAHIGDPTASGTFSALLAGGVSHSISLSTGGNLSVSGGTSFAGTEYGSFSFGITGAGAGAGAVPEPASWAMMIGGFALAGGALRNRRVAGLRFA